MDAAAADYPASHARPGRLSRRRRYGAASIVFFALGVIAVRALATDDVIGASSCCRPVLALAILAVDEVTRPANIYLTAVSANSCRARPASAGRRHRGGGDRVGARLRHRSYENFLS